MCRTVPCWACWQLWCCFCDCVGPLCGTPGSYHCNDRWRHVFCYPRTHVGTLRKKRKSMRNLKPLIMGALLDLLRGPSTWAKEDGISRSSSIFSWGMMPELFMLLGGAVCRRSVNVKWPTGSVMLHYWRPTPAAITWLVNNSTKSGYELTHRGPLVSLLLNKEFDHNSVVLWRNIQRYGQRKQSVLSLHVTLQLCSVVVSEPGLRTTQCR